MDGAANFERPSARVAHPEPASGWYRRIAGFGCGLVLLLSPAVQAQDAGSAPVEGNKAILTGGAERGVIDVTDVSGNGNRVTATLVNNSSNRIRDIQLVIRHTFLWANERSPGNDNPGRSEYFLVLGELAPNGKLAFEYQADPPLPERSDGTFETNIEVAGFTEEGAE